MIPFHRLIILLSLVIVAMLSAQDNSLISLNNFYGEEIRLAGLALDQEQTLQIDTRVIAPRRNHHAYFLCYAWILNADTRQVVWQLDEAEQQERDRHTARYSQNIVLPAGRYEIYYSTYPHHSSDEYWEINGFFNGLLRALFDDEDHHDKWLDDDLYDQCFLNINGSGKALDEKEVLDYQQRLKDEAALVFSATEDDFLQEKVFRIDQPIKVHIYAQGEARKDGDFDFGAIVNLKTRERVWQLTYRDSDHGGGAKKNRVFDEDIDLEPGLYKVFYVSDDSHSPRRWNEAPPYDPNFWGITLRVSSGNEKLISFLDSEEDLIRAKVVELTGAGDEEYLSQGFSLKRPLDLQIYAIGEGRRDGMYDYGWIIDAGTRKKVWEMDYENTLPAGGSAKNRLFDGLVHLEAGNYVAYYITDDSHSRDHWNAAPPYDPDKWGLSINVLDDSFREGDIVEFDEEDDPNLLARLVRIRDNARKNSDFSLSEDGFVHIYAIGEGVGGEMYDYAWIKNRETGKTVWEMTYRKTDRAGGAKKNRLFDDQVFLPAGNYTVYYESDDSHSFNDWNERPPADPLNWGVTISRLQK